VGGCVCVVWCGVCGVFVVCVGVVCVCVCVCGVYVCSVCGVCVWCVESRSSVGCWPGCLPLLMP